MLELSSVVRCNEQPCKHPATFNGSVSCHTLHEPSLREDLSADVKIFTGFTECLKPRGAIVAPEDLHDFVVRAGCEVITTDGAGLFPYAHECALCGWKSQLGSTFGSTYGPMVHFCAHPVCRERAREFVRSYAD